VTGHLDTTGATALFTGCPPPGATPRRITQWSHARNLLDFPKSAVQAAAGIVAPLTSAGTPSIEVYAVLPPPCLLVRPAPGRRLQARVVVLVSHMPRAGSEKIWQYIRIYYISTKPIPQPRRKIYSISQKTEVQALAAITFERKLKTENVRWRVSLLFGKKWTSIYMCLSLFATLLHEVCPADSFSYLLSLNLYKPAIGNQNRAYSEQKEGRTDLTLQPGCTTNSQKGLVPIPAEQRPRS
jgi:hypothetical protein